MFGNLVSLYSCVKAQGSEAQKQIVSDFMETFGLRDGAWIGSTAWIQTSDGSDYLIASDGTISN